MYVNAFKCDKHIELKQFIVLQFVYADSFVGVTTMQATDLLHLACKFKVELLEDHCITHLVENVKLSDAPKVFGVAHRRRLTDLRDLALDIMAKYAIKITAVYKSIKDNFKNCHAGNSRTSCQVPNFLVWTEACKRLF